MSNDPLINTIINKIKKEIGRVNILVAGKTGVGKSTLINAILKEEITETGVGTPITENIKEITKDDIPVSIFDSKGIVLQNYVEVFKELNDFIKKRNERSNFDDHIHLAYVCIAEGSSRIEEAEKDLVQLLHNTGIPVIVVLTKSMSTSGFIDEVKGVCGENADEVIRVHAKQIRLDDGHIIKPKHLDVLVTTTISILKDRKIPFIASQKISEDVKKNAVEEKLNIKIDNIINDLQNNKISPSDFISILRYEIITLISGIYGVKLENNFLKEVDKLLFKINPKLNTNNLEEIKEGIIESSKNYIKSLKIIFDEKNDIDPCNENIITAINSIRNKDNTIDGRYKKRIVNLKESYDNIHSIEENEYIINENNENTKEMNNNSNKIIDEINSFKKNNKAISILIAGKGKTELINNIFNKNGKNCENLPYKLINCKIKNTIEITTFDSRKIRDISKDLQELDKYLENKKNIKIAWIYVNLNTIQIDIPTIEKLQKHKIKIFVYTSKDEKETIEKTLNSHSFRNIEYCKEYNEIVKCTIKLLDDKEQRSSLCLNEKEKFIISQKLPEKDISSSRNNLSKINIKDKLSKEFINKIYSDLKLKITVPKNRDELDSLINEYEIKIIIYISVIYDVDLDERYIKYIKDLLYSIENENKKYHDCLKDEEFSINAKIKNELNGITTYDIANENGYISQRSNNNKNIQNRITEIDQNNKLKFFLYYAGIYKTVLSKMNKEEISNIPVIVANISNEIEKSKSNNNELIKMLKDILNFFKNILK